MSETTKPPTMEEYNAAWWAAFAAAGHEARKDDDGTPDIFVRDAGHHNGPGCVNHAYPVLTHRHKE